MSHQWLPPILIPLLRRFSSGSIKFKGHYSSWGEAASKATGYGAADILEKALVSTLKVRSGEAVFERDGVLFDEVHYDWPVTASLMGTAARFGGMLKVLDYGGALGSSYFQNLEFTQEIDVLWSIVEQKSFVTAGRRFLEDERLRFYDSIKACNEETQPNVVLVSSALQYIEDPYEVIHEIEATSAEFLILSRTPFYHGLCDRICVQHVPASIYSASYPVWIFSRHGFFAKLEGWSILATFESGDGAYLLDDLKRVTLTGFILERKHVPKS